MKKHLVLLSCMFVITSLISHTQCKEQENQMPQARVHSIEQPITIKLEANPSTGYTWMPIYNNEEVHLASKKFRSYPMGAGMAGVGGYETYTFHPLRDGLTSITFEYKKAWEKNVAPAKTKVYYYNLK